MQQPLRCPAAFNRAECLTRFNPWHHRQPFERLPQMIRVGGLKEQNAPRTLHVLDKKWRAQPWPLQVSFVEAEKKKPQNPYHHHVHACFELAGNHYHVDHFYLGLYGAGSGQAIVCLFENEELIGKALVGGTSLGFGWRFGWPLTVHCKAGLLRYNYEVNHFDTQRSADAALPPFTWYKEAESK